MKAALKLAELSIRSILRDSSALFWSFAFPALLLLALGLIWGHSGSPTLKVGLAGPADAPVVARLRKELGATGMFKVSQGPQAKELAALRAGRRHLVLICISAGRSGTAAVVRAYYDPRQEDSAQLVLASVRNVVTQIERQMIRQPVSLKLEEIPIRRRSAPKPRPVETLITAVIAMSIIQAGIGAAIALVSERQGGSSDVFRVSPVSVGQMIAGNLAARVLVGGAQTVAVVMTGVLVFGVAVRGSWWALIFLVVLGTLTFTAIGGALSVLARNVQGASGLVALVSLPLIFLSGLFFPIDALPSYAHAFALALPSSYLGDGLRWAVTGVASITSPSLSIAILVAWTMACCLIAAKFYRWE